LAKDDKTSFKRIPFSKKNSKKLKKIMSVAEEKGSKFKFNSDVIIQFFK